MTRQEELVQAARKEYPEWEEAQCHFIDGAKWADAHPHWISVEDELPPLECSMIVLISYGEDIQIGEWDNGSFHETKLGVIIHPTHWMPLPQPPKKGGEE